MIQNKEQDIRLGNCIIFFLGIGVGVTLEVVPNSWQMYLSVGILTIVAGWISHKMIKDLNLTKLKENKK